MAMALRELFAFRGRTSHQTDWLLAAIAFAGFLALWYAIAYFGILSQRFLPLPTAVVEALWRMSVEGDFISDIRVSIQRVMIAFALSVVMALPLGILMSTYRIVGALSEPIIDFIRYLPVPALVPLLIIWLGIEEESKIAVLWMGTFFQLVLLIADDAKRVPREFVEIGYTLGAKNWQILRDIVFRGMLPSTVDNLRITLGWCWTYLIVAEIVAANSGIGHAIWSMRRFVKTPEVMAGILTVGIIGLLTDQIIRFAHRRAFRYL
ncbi:MAG: ABC transporter permease [Alphaproteobacteria bacterium]